MRIVLALAIAATFSTALHADEYRYFTQNGVTYRDRIVNVPTAVPETQYSDRQETIYREQHLPSTRIETRTTYVPVQTQQLESRPAGVWPFNRTQTTQWVTRTQWVPQQQQVQIPVYRKTQLPETRTVRGAQVTMRYVDQPRIVERVVMGPGFVPPATDVNANPQALAAAPSLAPPSDMAGTVAPGAGAPGSLAPTGQPTLAPVPAGTAYGQANPGTPIVGGVPSGQSVVTASPVYTQIPVNGIQPYGAAVNPYQPTYRPGWGTPATVARREAVGGISRMESDPPRYATPVNPAPVAPVVPTQPLQGGMYR